MKSLIKKLKFLSILLLFSFNSLLSAQKINYRYLDVSPNTLINSLNREHFFITELNSKIFFQGKNNEVNITYYENNYTSIFEFKNVSDCLNLIDEIRDNAIFQYKYCSSYTLPIVYNYISSGNNTIRFNFEEKRISVQYPGLDFSFASEFLPVFICQSYDSYAWHTNLRCEGLNNCNSKIVETDKKNAKKNNYKICKICISDVE